MININKCIYIIILHCATDDTICYILNTIRVMMFFVITILLVATFIYIDSIIPLTNHFYECILVYWCYLVYIKESCFGIYAIY